MKGDVIIREYGALDYREFLGGDLFPKGMVSFTKKGKVYGGFKTFVGRERFDG